MIKSYTIFLEMMNAKFLTHYNYAGFDGVQRRDQL